MTTTMKTTNREIADTLGGLVDRFHDAATERHQKMILNEVLTLMLPHFRAWAPAFCRKSGDISYKHKDDLESVAAERVIQVLKESLTPGKHTGVENWYSYLYGVSQYAVLAYYNSAAVTPASGMTSLSRRQRLLAHTREEMRNKLGRDPEDQELIDAHNTKMRGRRSNPEKQGALVSLADLENILPVADIADHDRAVTHDDAVITGVEARDLIRGVVEACYQISPQLGQTAEVWVGSAYAEPPVIGDEKDVARAVGVTRARAGALMTQVREHAKDIAQRVYGIDSFAI